MLMDGDSEDTYKFTQKQRPLRFLIKISSPSSNFFIEFLDDLLCRQRQSSPAREILNLRSDSPLGFPGRPYVGEIPSCPWTLPHLNGESQEVKTLLPRIQHPGLLCIER